MDSPNPALDLPRLMLITDRAQMQPSFLQVLEQALEDGAKLVQMREKDLREPELLELAQRARAMCDAHGAMLIINRGEQAAHDSRARGVQRSMRDLDEDIVRQTSHRGLLVGASAHSVDEARRAQVLGAHYLILGSIFPTASHPEGVPLGLQVLEEAVQSVSIPIFAVGGINASNAQHCIEAGAHGVAMIRAAWNREQRRALLQVLGEADRDRGARGAF